MKSGPLALLKCLAMPSALVTLLVVLLLQHFPFLPPPPSGFEIHSAYVQENFYGVNVNNAYVNNNNFRGAVENNPQGSSFYGYNGFLSIWAAVQDGRITSLNRSNWKCLVDYTINNSLDATRTLVCEAAKVEGHEFNGDRCENFYLPLSRTIYYMLLLSFLFVVSLNQYNRFRAGKTHFIKWVLNRMHTEFLRNHAICLSQSVLMLKPLIFNLRPHHCLHQFGIGMV